MTTLPDSDTGSESPEKPARPQPLLWCDSCGMLRRHATDNTWVTRPEKLYADSDHWILTEPRVKTGEPPLETCIWSCTRCSSQRFWGSR